MHKCRHKWKMVFHLDGCHHYSSHFTCTKACGCTATSSGERSFNDAEDPYAVIWSNEDCERCKELIHNPERRERWGITYFDPQGKVTTRKFK